MELDERMLDPDAKYRDPEGRILTLAMYDYSYVYLRAPFGQEIILTHQEFNQRVFDGTLQQVFKQPDLLFPERQR